MPDGTLVEIMLQAYGRKIDYAEEFDWEEEYTRHAIFAYRIIQPEEGITEPSDWQN